MCVFSFCSTIWTIFEHFPSFILLRYSYSMWCLLLLYFFGNFSTFITFLGVSFALILVSFLWSFFFGYFRIFFIASLIPGTWHCDPYWVLINWKKNQIQRKISSWNVSLKLKEEETKSIAFLPNHRPLSWHFRNRLIRFFVLLVKHDAISQ